MSDNNNDYVEAVVANESDLKEGEMKEVELGEGKVLLTKHEGKIYATGNKCTHYGASLKTGSHCKGRIRCPWHGACFDIKTGDIEDFPGMDGIHTFEVNILNGGQVNVKAPKNAFKEWKKTGKMAKCSHQDKRLFVVVGAGPGGAMCAETLRKEGFTGKILLVGKESHLAYDRPKLSKALSIQTDKILLRNHDFYKQNDIEVLLSTEVVDLDASTKTIKLSNGTTLQYDAAFVSTGGTPRTIPSPGYNLKNIYPLRDPEDAQAINERVENARVVVVGSSFIGMEIASCIAKKAKSVVVVGMENVPFERVLGEKLGTQLQILHEKNGVSFRMRRVVKEFRGIEDKVMSVLLDNGEILDADLCIVGAGIIPATKFLRNVTLERDASVVCDKYLKGGDGLYIGGDIARYPYFLSGNSTDTVRVEHYGMAHYHGKIAAQNMLGQQVEARSVPFFWTTQYGKSIRYCGSAYQYDELYFEGNVEELKFVGYYIKGDKVLAVVSIGMDPIVAAAAELMYSGKFPSASEIKNNKIDLVKLAASL